MTGFANLPTVMISDSSEVLWELISVAREVRANPVITSQFNMVFIAGCMSGVIK